MLSLFSHFGASADRRVLTSRFARPYCFVLVANFPCFQSCQPRFPPVSSLFISLLLRNPTKILFAPEEKGESNLYCETMYELHPNFLGLV